MTTKRNPGLRWEDQDEGSNLVYVARHDFGRHGTGKVTYMIRPVFKNTKWGPQVKGYEVEVRDLRGHRKGFLVNFRGHLSATRYITASLSSARTMAEVHAGLPGRAENPRRRRNPKLFARSMERYRATASERRLYGGNTVTKFWVGYEGSDPTTWVEIVGYGPTPGERKTYAIKKFQETHGEPGRRTNPRRQRHNPTRKHRLQRRSNPYFDVVDLPPGIQSVLQEVGYGRQNIKVDAAETYTPAIGAGDGSKAFTAVVDLTTDRYKIAWGSWGGSNIHSRSQIDLDTSTYPIPPNGAVVQGSIGGARPAWAFVSVHPSNLPRRLSSGQDEQLSRDEQRAVVIIARIKGGRRTDYFHEYKLGAYGPQNPAIQALGRRGLVKITKTGVSITTAGRNLVEEIRHKVDVSV